MCVYLFLKKYPDLWAYYCRWWMQSPVKWFYLSSMEKHSQQNSFGWTWLDLQNKAQFSRKKSFTEWLRWIMTEKIYIKKSNFGYLWPLMTKSKKCFMGSFCKIWIQLALLHRAPLNIILRFVFFVFNTLI